MVTKVKICGITNLEDALAAVSFGCDALGFIFYKKSKRYVDPDIARAIISSLPDKIIKVGVFVDASAGEIKKIARLCKLDILQFHGQESPEFCAKFNKYKVIKVFRIKNKLDLKNILKYNVFAYLFDTFQRNRLGGTGRAFNWRLLSDLKGVDKPIFLAGGLNEGNVDKAIKLLKPTWVDASSSLEKSLGKKDHLRMAKFIKKAKG